MIAISGGGTGGHFFPAYAVYKHFLENNIPSIFIGSLNSIESNFKDENFYLFDIKKNLNLPSRLLNYLKISRKISKLLKEKNIKLVIGFGGYVSFPLYLAAYISKIPIIVHEQNSLFGKANKLFSRFAKKIFVGFPYFEGKDIRNLEHSKLIWTSNPLRKEVEKYDRENKKSLKEKLKIPLSKKVLLIFGGSQGALFLNEAFEYIASLYPDLLKNFFLIHITGKGKGFFRLKSLYEKNNYDFQLFEFKENLGPYLKVADFVVCRAGALTVTEVCYFRKKALFIPYPYAYKNHQYKNIEPLIKQDLAKVFVQNLTKEDKRKFLDTFLEFLDWGSKKNENELDNLEKYILKTSKDIILKESLKILNLQQ